MKSTILRSYMVAAVVGVTGILSNAFALTGWAVFAGSDGKVYKCSVGGSPEAIYQGTDAAHAMWSADGRYVYFIKGTGELWAMGNNGSSLKRLAAGKNTGNCPIAGYRPDAKRVLYVEGATFYRIGIDDADKVVVHTASKSYIGEIAISTDGKRMAARSGSLDRIVVGGASTRYAGDCSSSLSPNGEFLTQNGGTHTDMDIFNWAGSKIKLLSAGGKHWDNQRFAVNSDDYIVYKIEKGTSHDGAGVGVVQVSTNAHSSITTRVAEYPDFFLGNPPGATVVGSVAALALSGPSADVPKSGTRFSISGRTISRHVFTNTDAIHIHASFGEVTPLSR